MNKITFLIFYFIYKIFIRLNRIDRKKMSILHPKNDEIYLDYSKNKAKLDGWKADSYDWENCG